MHSGVWSVFQSSCAVVRSNKTSEGNLVSFLHPFQTHDDNDVKFLCSDSPYLRLSPQPSQLLHQTNVIPFKSVPFILTMCTEGSQTPVHVLGTGIEYCTKHSSCPSSVIPSIECEQWNNSSSPSGRFQGCKHSVKKVFIRGTHLIWVGRLGLSGKTGSNLKSKW